VVEMVEMWWRWFKGIPTTTKILTIKELRGGGGDGGDFFY
jgi:hypothetical protein